MAGPTHAQTAGAIPVAFVLCIVGLFVGELAKMLYLLFVGPMFEGGVLNWLSGGLFGEIALSWFPPLLQGMIGGTVGIYLTSQILKRANYLIVAYALAAVVGAFGLVGVAGLLQRNGVDLAQVAVVANTVGTVVGLFIGWRSIREARPETDVAPQ
ncbi:hypothetical protein CKO28_23645 [Rhodovibrio sodomensis]|uniref:Uncharacterized protein n=1 Tax=Rhodovibrio sodomensis TaxID=1088 RepID=A0ABS1DKG3_9PROT|nr:hypothetical protein [Rhodovibrio sodomensis]MBK1671005.1 hypothetical protein [Rhodovibrio sodomensis]